MNQFPSVATPFKPMKIIGFFCTSLLLTALSYNAQSEIYKWVDKDGNAHYSDIKPNNKDITNIKTRSGTSTNMESDDPADKARALAEEKKTEDDIATRQSSIDADKAKLAEKCAAIRDNLKKIEENSRIRIEEEGKIRFLTAEEIIEKKNVYQKMLDEACTE